MGIPVLPPAEDVLHTDSDSYNEDDEDDEGVEVEELEDQLRALEEGMGNGLHWSLTIPEALAAHPDLGDLPPEEEEAINAQFMGTALCPRPSVTLLLSRSCYCYTMALDQPPGHPNPPRRVACRAADGRAVTYRDVQRHLAAVPRCNHVFLEAISQVAEGVYDCSFGS